MINDLSLEDYFQKQKNGSIPENIISKSKKDMAYHEFLN